MFILGLTGSMGMGKSTAAAAFRALGVPVLDADAEVHRLYAGAAVEPIENAFPGTTSASGVDRARLSAALLKDPSGFKRLEQIVHPLVRAAEREFLVKHERDGIQLAVLEIPLLFETGGDRLVDAVAVVSAAPEKQRERLLLRPGMTAEKLDGLLKRQTNDAEKRARADFVVDTNGTIAETEAAVARIAASLRGRRGEAFSRHWAGR
jgi:dephospho-CoA kinase